ncbi:MAG TPA: transcription-repair coupling factor [Myxococcaceae bacterium]|nr:transcription-repair coupling factor [Myxococcaceae bacterium]
MVSEAPPPPFPARADAGDPDAFPRLAELVSAGPGALRAQGLKGAARGYVLARLHRTLGVPLVCVAVDEEAAEHLAADLAFFLGGRGAPERPNVLVMPADEVLPFDEASPDATTVSERLGALFHLSRGTPFAALVLSRRMLMRRVLRPELMAGLAFRVAAGEDHPRDDLARRLVRMGYQTSPLVEDPGTFSVRGDLVDVFSPLYEQPLRLELFGDKVESIRLFDPETQRTVGAVKHADLAPARELLVNDETLPRAEAALRAAAERTNTPTSKVRGRIDQLREQRTAFGLEGLLPGFFEGGLGTVFDSLAGLPRAPVFYLDDPMGQDRVESELRAEMERSHEDAVRRGDFTLPPDAHFLGEPELREALKGRALVEGGGLSLTSGEQVPLAFSFGTTEDLRAAILTHHGEEGALTPLVERLQRWQEMGVAAAVACGTAGQVDRLKRLLLDRGLIVRVHQEAVEDPGKLFELGVHAHLFTGEISHGFVDGRGGFAVLSDEEIFGVRSRRRVRQRKVDPAFTQAFRELKEGDLIVHTDFGIGRYRGLIKMDVRGVTGDFLVLEYAGRDKIYLPVHRMKLVQKFTGGDPDHVALDKLGGTSWEKTKKRIKENLLQMAAELLRIYAARQAHPGFAFTQPDRYYRQFEADFEFEETPDQEKAIHDVLDDMQKPEPMDRLVCGDVGYGKTEVAMRAAFKAVLDHKQVAVLVPTTVLAQQHHLTFKKRFADYPVTIEMVSRLHKAAVVREVLRRAKEGKVDVLIGTHKLLGSEVGFKDLGLLVVDEEQRFGVKQKEQIKRLRTQVDVLTLTATPIPRTLNMAMSGVRDMSIIATPPADRRAIRTFVVKFDPAQIREAVVREIQRGGQVFFVHNRIQSIHSMEKLIRELVPEVTVAVAHGQMAEGQLERVMTEFVDKKHQVLLCTAIIESGIDIPSANTMIVNRADQFGLAQLYQLRGRVGRSKERAYAYLVVPARRNVTRDAQRRLEVLQAFTELGAGFSIASHDLEIRGAGNLLGEDQSGMIAEIGFDLYTQLLEEAVAEMKGEPPPSQIEPEISLPFAALLPDDYVPDVHQRLVFYKRFSVAATEDELSDLRAELVDRYGDPPEEVDHLWELTGLKIELRELQLRGLESGPGRLVFALGADAKLDPAKMAALVQRSRGAYRLTPDMKLMARVPEGLKGVELVNEAKKVLRDLGSCSTAVH